MADRKQIRQKIREERHKLSAETIIQASLQLTENICETPIFNNAHTISVYIASQHEVDPFLITQKIWERQKRAYLPVLSEKHLLFLRYEPQTILTPNRFHIPEPTFVASNLMAAEKIDLVLLPLVAFDTFGNRLGMGAGFYDRTFAFLNHNQKTRPSKPYLMGLAYEFQKYDEIIPEDWDVKLNGVITEKNFYSF